MNSNMKFKKKIQLLEDFETTTKTTVSNPNAVVKKETTQVNVDTKQADSRSEIMQDVDNIINNLSQLSDRIAEEWSLYLESFDPLYEASFMDEVMKQFSSMKAYAKLRSAYPKLRKQKLALEVKKEFSLAQFDAQTGDKKEAAEAKVKKQFDAKKEKINQSDMPREKKVLARKKIDELWDKQKEQISKKISDQIANQKEQMKVKFDQEISKAGDKLKEFESANKIESDLLSKQWEKAKVNIDNEQDLKHIKDTFDAKAQWEDSDDPEVAERQQKKMAEMVKAQKEEAAKAAAKSAEQIKNAQEEADARAEKGDEKTKAANLKLKNFYGAVSALIGVLKSTEPDDYDDAAKAEVKTKKKDYSAAKKEMNANVFVDGGVASDADEGEDLLISMQDEVDTALDDFDAVLAVLDDTGSEDTNDGNDGEPKDGEPKDGEPKDGEPKDGEPKDGEPKDGEPKDGEPDPKELEKANKKIEDADAELAKEAEMQKNGDVTKYKLSGKISAQINKAMALKNKAELEGDSEEATSQQAMADALRDDLKAQLKKEEERESKKDESKLHELLTVAQKFKALM